MMLTTDAADPHLLRRLRASLALSAFATSSPQGAQPPRYPASTNASGASAGAAQWRSALLIPDPSNTFARAAGWDSSGRPTKLWARYATDGGRGDWYLLSHPLSA